MAVCAAAVVTACFSCCLKFFPFSTVIGFALDNPLDSHHGYIKSAFLYLYIRRAHPQLQDRYIKLAEGRLGASPRLICTWAPAFGAPSF